MNSNRMKNTNNWINLLQRFTNAGVSETIRDHQAIELPRLRFSNIFIRDGNNDMLASTMEVDSLVQM